MSWAGDANLWSADLNFAHKLAEVASDIAVEHFGSSKSQTKADGTPVGEGDIAVDRALTRMIRSEYPADAILSEESEPVGFSSRRWIIDPIDGTVQFLEGSDGWGTLVALEEDGEVVLGVVRMPLRSKVWWAVRGQGSWTGTVQDRHIEDMNPLHVSQVDELSQSRMTVWPVEAQSELVQWVKSHARWEEPSAERVLELSAGDFEAVCGYAGGPWDHAPAVVLVEEAGGQFCDPRGGRRLDLRGGIYTNSKIDTEFLHVALSRDH
jgi:histidinol-phosphatase